MKLPNRESAYIPSPKLHDYLLSKTHTYRRHTARNMLSKARSKPRLAALCKCGRCGLLTQVKIVHAL